MYFNGHFALFMHINYDKLLHLMQIIFIIRFIEWQISFLILNPEHFSNDLYIKLV